MTLKELENEVLSLMLETEFDDYASFILSANRALSEIHTERDRVCENTVYIESPEISFLEEKLAYKPENACKIELTGKAFSLIASGVGKLLFTDNDETEEISFSGNRVVIKRFINTGHALLEFTGNYDYEIHSLAAFTGIRSGKKEDIELFGSFKEYEMRKIDPLFISFVSEALDEKGERINDAVMSPSGFKLPFLFTGEICLRYKRRPRMITEREADEEIDIAEECVHLLPILTAAYLLPDDNAELSSYYMGLFREGMAAVKVYNRTSCDNSYTDVLGWAK